MTSSATTETYQFLLKMGFEEQSALKAAKMCPNNINKAINVALNYQANSAQNYNTLNIPLNEKRKENNTPNGGNQPPKMYTCSRCKAKGKHWLSHCPILKKTNNNNMNETKQELNVYQYGDKRRSAQRQQQEQATDIIQQPGTHNKGRRQKKNVSGCKKSAAYVTYCMPDNNELIMYCCTLGLRLKSEGCEYERVLMLPYKCFTLNGELRGQYAIFRRFFDSFKSCAHTDKFPFYYFKIHAFSLIEYEKVMFIEPNSIINDDQLEIYYDDVEHLPSSPIDLNGAHQFEVMVIKPDQYIFNELYRSLYSVKQQCINKVFCDLLESMTEWNHIENETDKDEWLYCIKLNDVLYDKAYQSFVVGYFVDVKPWEMYKCDNDSCVAINIWMETARKLIQENTDIATLVHPKILTLIKSTKIPKAAREEKQSENVYCNVIDTNRGLKQEVSSINCDGLGAYTECDSKYQDDDSEQFNITSLQNEQGMNNTYKHQWKHMKHTVNAKKHKAKCCIVMIGATGSGKSKLIQLLSGNKNVKSSGSVDSVTHNIELIQSEYGDDLWYLDTIGTGDSNRTFNDIQILKLAFKHLHKYGIDNIKIIWSVKGDTERKEAQFGQQAEFIKNLQQNNHELEGEGDTHSSPWDSCLIIKKGGGSKTDNIAGIIAAAKDHGAYNINDKHNLFGFKCIDWSKYEEVQYIPSYKLSDCGFFTENEAQNIISTKLKAFPSFKLLFQKQKCTKCGITGDSRYVDAPCHTTKEIVHVINKTSFKHTGKLMAYHPKGLDKIIHHIERRHRGQQISQHSGRKIKYHSGELKVSKGKIVKHVALGAVPVIAVTLSVIAIIATGGLVAVGVGVGAGSGGVASIAVQAHEVGSDKGKMKWWSCCEQYEEDAIPCISEWTCCGKDGSVIECINQPDATKICSECKQKWKDIGCEVVNKMLNGYLCCKQEESSSGCKNEWNCCLGETNEIGCKEYFECCNGDKDSRGCAEKCRNCKKIWGTGPGCISVE